MKNNNIDEQEYLKQYNQGDYDRPSITTDIVVFTLKQEEKSNYRRVPKKFLSILLIKRGVHPYKGEWALPGGFVRMGETVEEAASRKLKEETGVSTVNLSQLHCFSEPKRDPRGWIISSSFMALAKEDLFFVNSGYDAIDAQWFHVDYKRIAVNTVDNKSGSVTSNKYRLELTHEDIELSAIIEVKVFISSKRHDIEYKILESEGIAFDHSKIIAYAINQLRDNLHISMLGFELMPEYFTLRDLQDAFEAISDKKLLTANFRRKISDYVIETDMFQEGLGHRPAKFYKRNYENLII